MTTASGGRRTLVLLRYAKSPGPMSPIMNARWPRAADEMLLPWGAG